MRYSDSRADPRINFQSGFTFIEVMVALAITTIVMGAIFSLLARGLSTTPAELERADLQAQARHALGQISRDILAAGADLPPEFPAFTSPNVNPALGDGTTKSGYSGISYSGDSHGPDAIEIVGNLGGINSRGGRVRVLSFDGATKTAVLDAAPTQIERGDLVLVYDDAPTRGTWIFGLVSLVDLGANRVTLKTMPGEQEGDTVLPPFISNYNRPLPSSGYLTPVTVVTYTTGSPTVNSMAGNPDTELVLRRQVNWGEPIPVAYVEDLQIRYFVANTIDDLEWLKGPGDPGGPIIQAESDGQGDPGDSTPAGERELDSPPIPQPDPGELLQPDGLVRGVHVTVASRSHQANLEGSTRLPEQAGGEQGFLRSIYSTRVATRNLLMGLHSRMNLQGFN